MPSKRYNSDMLELLFPLAITLAIEVPIYLLMRWRNLKLFIVASVSNIVLNLLMNILLTRFSGNDYYLFLGLYEVLTTLVEALIIFLVCKSKYIETLLHALAANMTSFIVGLLLNYLYDLQALIVVLTILFFAAYAFVGAITVIHYVKTRGKENANE